MGDTWERMVRSVKRVLYSLLKEQSVCDETLLTVMSEVEAILNSRPITTVTMDSSDEPLSPNHLLLLRPNDNLPPGIFVKEDGFGKRQA
ncbi:hypothetical protein HOLleu_20858 [Holothuria leucospilota]|uniref:Uncharacterized protein n=1 Tax=Holothuria leucospilota TaxID=206669 RepID=A0A9Q1H5L3_HOLLE|nr:hypothetical protein HOLleu_20858 [Holothuria leucospilota]